MAAPICQTCCRFKNIGIRYIHNVIRQHFMNSTKTVTATRTFHNITLSNICRKYRKRFIAYACCAVGLGCGVLFHNSINFFSVIPKINASEKWDDMKNDRPTLKYNFLADAVEKVAPAVVFLQIYGRHPYHGGSMVISNGSGFIVRENGLILTNAHVVANKQKVTVKLHDGRMFEGIVMSIDQVSDLATIKINCESLPVLKLGDSSTVRPGEWVVAVGSPLSLSNTVTAGIISTVHRGSAELGINNRDMDYIQTDAVINFGNSGGPLVNLDGEAIGINTMKVTTGISFAIPSDYAKEFLRKSEELIKRSESKGWFRAKEDKPSGRRYIGITMVTLDPSLIQELAQMMENFPDIQNGVLIHTIIVGSPAHTGGICVGDVIVSANGKQVKSSTDMYNAIATITDLDIVLWRGREKIRLRITPEDAE